MHEKEMKNGWLNSEKWLLEALAAKAILALIIKDEKSSLLWSKY